jgi:hypothetical protein
MCNERLDNKLSLHSEIFATDIHCGHKGARDLHRFPTAVLIDTRGV